MTTIRISILILRTNMLDNCTENLKFMTWNATGIMSSCSYLIDTIKFKNIDICGISEHWLRETDLHFLDNLDSNFKCYASCDYDLRVPKICTVRKGGVALMWNTKHTSRISPLLIEDDRIIGIQYQCSNDCFLYIFQIYLPSSGHSLSKYNEYIEKLSDIVQMYSDKGTLIILGDTNAHISSHKFIKRTDRRTAIFEKFLINFNLMSANTLDICQGAKSSFVSYNGINESLIDHIILPFEIKDTIISCEIVDDHALNVSTHRPIVCEITLPVYDTFSHDLQKQPKLKWSKSSVSNLKDFELYISKDDALIQLLETNIYSIDRIDNFYSVMVKSLIKISDKYIPKTKFRHFLKPYWSSELTILHL